MKLVDDAKKAWTWFCMWAMSAAATLQAVYIALPAELKASIPADWVQILTVVILIFGMFGRLVKQQK